MFYTLYNVKQFQILLKSGGLRYPQVIIKAYRLFD